MYTMRRRLLQRVRMQQGVLSLGKHARSLNTASSRMGSADAGRQSGQAATDSSVQAAARSQCRGRLVFSMLQ